jgi:hypothetical protein
MYAYRFDRVVVGRFWSLLVVAAYVGNRNFFSRVAYLVTWLLFRNVGKGNAGIVSQK